MRSLVIALLMLGVGAVAGYELYPLTHRATDSARSLPGGNAREVVEFNLTPEQVDHLAARIAPAVAQRITAQGPSKAAPESSDAQRQAKAFDEATQIVDQMIAGRRVTTQGMGEAKQLLDDSGQSERMFEISARVSAAVNRGELTLEQAGLLPHQVN